MRFAAAVGSWGGRFISLAIIISTFGITNVFIMTGARVYRSMAESGAFLPAAGRVHPRFGTPHVAIILQSGWATVLLLSNTYGQLLQFVTFGDWIFFGLTALALIVLRRKMPDAPRPYKVWGYPVVPAVFFLVSAAVVVNVFAASFLKSAVGTLLILIGLPVYLFSRRQGVPMEFEPFAHMEWAKLAKHGRLNLGRSGVPGLTLADLGLSLEGIEINGEHPYGYPPLVESIAARHRAQPENVIPSVGTSMAIFHVCAASSARAIRPPWSVRLTGRCGPFRRSWGRRSFVSIGRSRPGIASIRNPWPRGFRTGRSSSS